MTAPWKFYGLFILNVLLAFYAAPQKAEAVALQSCEDCSECYVDETYSHSFGEIECDGMFPPWNMGGFESACSGVNNGSCSDLHRAC